MRAFFFIAICLFFNSCFDKGDCLITNTNFVKVNVKDASARASAKSVLFTSIHIPETGIVYQNKELSTLVLPVDPRLNETKFVFQYMNESDTLVLSYNNQTVVLASDCGSFLFQKDLEIKHDTFGTDRAIVRNNRLLKSVTLNIEIFL